MWPSGWGFPHLLTRQGSQHPEAGLEKPWRSPTSRPPASWLICPEGQPPPCIGLPKTTWMESHGSGVGSSTRPPQICWLPWCLLACRYIIPPSSHHSLPQCVAIPGLKFPSCKDINTIGPGPTVMMVCQPGHICRDPVSKWGAGFKDPTVSFLRDTVQPRIPACVTLSLLTLRMPTSK